MITKENGLRYAKLIHVSVDNGMTEQSNKYYTMEEQSDGQIKCEYGRVGRSGTVEFKPAYKWDKVYKEKTGPKKNYTDVTDMIAESVTVDTSVPSGSPKTATISDAIVRKLIEDLMAFANKSIQQNYKVTQDAVTELQVERAQAILNEVITSIKLKCDIAEVNNNLLKLYTVIPRRMDNVKNYILDPITNKDSLERAQRFLSNEQDTLDTMAGQVTLLKQQKEANKPAEVTETKGKKKKTELNILEQMGLIITVETDAKQLELIHKLLGSNQNRARNIYKVVNTKTQDKFEKHVAKAADKKRRMYWHGSRNENWFNITQTGLLIRPSGAIHTGSMFGDGIYFADKSSKSLGYSSLSGSRWTNGNSRKGYLALFDVHLGKQKDITHHTHDCYSFSQKVMDKEGYDSVFAHGGADLINNEFIVYDAAKCTMSYLIEME
jgi:poly [ADP-ribose] polymerase